MRNKKLKRRNYLKNREKYERRKRFEFKDYLRRKHSNIYDRSWTDRFGWKDVIGFNFGSPLPTTKDNLDKNK